MFYFFTCHFPSEQMREKLRNLVFLFILEIISIDTTLSSNFRRGMCKARKNQNPQGARLQRRVPALGQSLVPVLPAGLQQRWAPRPPRSRPRLALQPGLLLGTDRARCPCGQSARHLVFANWGLPPYTRLVPPPADSPCATANDSEFPCTCGHHKSSSSGGCIEYRH